MYVTPTLFCSKVHLVHCKSNELTPISLLQGLTLHRASFPRIPGHEMIGDIVAIGDGEKKWRVSDRVGGAWHGGHDGTCKACNRGLFQMCDNAVANRINRDGGCESPCLKAPKQGPLKKWKEGMWVEADSDYQMQNTVPSGQKPPSASPPPWIPPPTLPCSAPVSPPTTPCAT